MTDVPTVTAAPRRRLRHPLRWLAVAALGAALAMIPWTVSLGRSLPARYVTDNWDITWVGFDTALIAGFAAIAATAWLRSRYLGTAAMITATLLACDAWFDITTAATPDDQDGSLFTALGEIPIAAGLVVLVVRTVQRRRAAATPPETPMTAGPIDSADPAPAPAPAPACERCGCHG